MPGTIPATSQLDRLISMTAINVLAGSRAMRDRLKLFNVCMGSSIGSQRTMDAIPTPPPHSIFHALFGRIGARAKMQLPIHPHMLRHGCGYALANAGHDTRARQAWLGHTNIRHTVRYTELAPDRFENSRR